MQIMATCRSPLVFHRVTVMYRRMPHVDLYLVASSDCEQTSMMILFIDGDTTMTQIQYSCL